MTIHPITAKDVSWVTQALQNLWGSEEMITRGKLINLSGLSGFIAEEDERKVGLVTYKIDDNECEMTSLNALIPGKGIGTALIEKVVGIAQENNCKKVIVITTNDNTKALHFYQKKGFIISAVRLNVMQEYRKLKPQMPVIGEDGIPLRDEIELERKLV